MTDSQDWWPAAFGHYGPLIGIGPEVTWTSTPPRWDNSFSEILFGYEWDLVKSPAGAWQYQAKDGAGASTFPDPEDGTLNGRRRCS